MSAQQPAQIHPAVQAAQTFFTKLGADQGRVRLFRARADEKAVNYVMPAVNLMNETASPLARLANTHNVYYSTANFGPSTSGTVENVIGINALSVDLDAKDVGLGSIEACMVFAHELIALLGVEPAVLVNSGHGLNVHWAIDDMEARWEVDDEETRQRWVRLIKRWGQTVQALADKGGKKVDSTFSIERVWRAGGTLNTKPDQVPVEAQLTWSKDDVESLSFDQIEDAIRGVIGDAPEEPLGLSPAMTALMELAPDASLYPDAIARRVQGYVETTVSDISLDLRGLRHDARTGWDNEAVKLAFRLVELAESPWAPFTIEQARSVMVEYMPTDAGFPKARVLAKFESALKRPSAGRGVAPPAWLPEALMLAQAAISTGIEPEDYEFWKMRPMNDLGNAQRLIDHYSHELRWVADRKTWASWDGVRWAVDNDGGPRMAIRMVRTMREVEGSLYEHNPAKVKPGEKREKTPRERFQVWAEEQQSVGKIEAAAKGARYSGEITSMMSEYDQHPLLLNVLNGTVDLTNGELMEPNPSLMMTQLSGVQYDPDAKAPRWQKFLDEMMPNGDGMQDFLQRAVGYSMTGSTSEQVMFVHYGGTKNGKSVFLQVVEAILGDYSQVVPATTLLATKNDQHPTEIARMEGKRMLQMSETTEGARLDEALVKRLTGQETVTARGMGENFRDMRISGKIHLITNHLPHITDDRATKRRIQVVHWAQTIDDDKKDIKLAERIIGEELPGVLAWAVRGCLEWQRRGLDTPTIALLNAMEYFNSEDVFGEFIDENLMESDSVKTSALTLYQAYQAWSFARGERNPLTSNTFSKKLASRGFKNTKGNANGKRMVAVWNCALTAAPAERPDPFGR